MAPKSKTDRELEAATPEAGSVGGEPEQRQLVDGVRVHIHPVAQPGHEWTRPPSTSKVPFIDPVSRNPPVVLDQSLELCEDGERHNEVEVHEADPDDSIETLVDVVFGWKEPEGPPQQTLRGDDGSTVVELLTLVGSVWAPQAARGTLEQYGIHMDHAIYQEGARVWERCLFSVEGHRALMELREKGQFPYEFKAVLSQGGVAWQLSREENADAGPPQTIESYLVPSLEIHRNSQ